MKFAMVGDRVDNDIDPPAKLLPREQLVTIRLFSGRYAQERGFDAKRFTPPRFCATTLAQVKAILLTKGTWAEIGCATDPPILNWQIDLDDPAREIRGDRVPVQIVLCGIGLDPDRFRTIPAICTGVLRESIESGPEIADQIVARYLETRPLPVVTQEAEMRQRILKCLRDTLDHAGHLTEKMKLRIDTLQEAAQKEVADARERDRDRRSG